MPIRDPLTTSLPDPPDGLVRIAFWRHIAGLSNSPELLALHRERAELVHELVDAAELDVHSWGDVDADHPSEVVEILVIPFAAAIAGKVVEFLYERIKDRRRSRENSIKAVSMRRADGAEIVWDFRHPVSVEQADDAISRFMEGQAVERVLGR